MSPVTDEPRQPTAEEVAVAVAAQKAYKEARGRPQGASDVASIHARLVHAWRKMAAADPPDGTTSQPR